MFKGEKVILRPVRREDLPLPMLEAEYEQNWAKGGRDNANFVIEADGKCIGGCALFQFEATAQVCELGITIGDRDYWGQGYGRDAVRTLLRYGFQYRNLHKIFLRVHARNERAIRAYRAVGFVEEGRLRAQVWSNGAYDDLIVMGMLREEWAAQG